MKTIDDYETLVGYFLVRVNHCYLTSAVFMTQVRKPPHITKTNRITNQHQYKLSSTFPSVPATTIKAFSVMMVMMMVMMMVLVALISATGPKTTKA